MKLGVVILNWNGKELLEKFIPSLLKYTPKEHSVYVVDNGSEDQSIEFVKNTFSDVKIIRLDKNYGFAKGYNLGLGKVEEEILCLLNNDVEVTANWTESILKQFKTQSNTAVIQPKMLNYNNKSYFDYAGAAGGYLDKYGYPYCRGRVYDKIEKDNCQYDKENADIFWACGACFFIRNSVFKEMNGFDELFWAHMEEIDLCWRIKNKGFLIKYNQDSIVYHVNAATLNHDNPEKTFLNFRNKLFMLSKNSRGNLFFLMVQTLIIDIIVSIFYLFNKGLKHFSAIIKAYLSFYKHINQLMDFRNKNERKIKHYKIYSIMFKYLGLKRGKSL
jgi:GT2 family glycosyltransferase